MIYFVNSERKNVLKNVNNDLNNENLNGDCAETNIKAFSQKNQQNSTGSTSENNPPSADSTGENGQGSTDSSSENGNETSTEACDDADKTFCAPPKSNTHNAPNMAELLNSYLFDPYTQKKIKPPKKDSAWLKKFCKTAGLLLLTMAVAFSGAFACIYWICDTALLGDSEFFRTLMIKNSGVTVNKVEVETITGSYQEDTISLAEKIKESSVDLQIFNDKNERIGSGSGVIISKDGIAVTNYHVVYGHEKSLKAVLSNGTVCDVSVTHLDKISDLAVIKIETDKTLTPATWADSDKAKPGQSIAICGNPLGLGFSVSFGKIGHPNRDLGEVSGNFIQLDASVNPGNSGGGLFDGAGNLLGITNSKASGTNVDGIGYAIPINRVMNVINQLFKDGYVHGRPAIGFTLVQVNESTWDYFKNGDGTEPGALEEYLYESVYGIYILKSIYNTEILTGDRIVSCNGIDFNDRDVFSDWLLKYKPGDKINVTVERITNITQDPKTGSYVITRQKKTFVCTLQERNWPDEPYTK